MPNRILREGILTSEKVNELSPEAEVFYRRLMSVVDDFGRIEAHPQILLTKCYPFQLDRVSAHDVREWLADCAHDADNEPLISVYSVKGKIFLQINNFGQRERTPKCPGPQDAGAMPAECPHDADTLRESAAYARATNPNTNSYPNPPSNVFSSQEEIPEVSPGLVIVEAEDPATNPLTILDGCCEIYRAAGRPVPDSQREHILRLIVGVDPPRRRLRIPRYIAWALQTGLWPRPDKTKAFLALMQGTDWDVDVVTRTLPQSRAPTPRDSAIADIVRHLEERGNNAANG